jgi:hypothetical protein
VPENKKVHRREFRDYVQTKTEFKKIIKTTSLKNYTKYMGRYIENGKDQ